MSYGSEHDGLPATNAAVPPGCADSAAGTDTDSAATEVHDGSTTSDDGTADSSSHVASCSAHAAATGTCSYHAAKPCSADRPAAYHGPAADTDTPAACGNSTSHDAARTDVAATNRCAAASYPPATRHDSYTNAARPAHRSRLPCRTALARRRNGRSSGSNHPANAADANSDTSPAGIEEDRHLLHVVDPII